MDTGNIKSVFSLFIQLVIAQAEYADTLNSLAVYITSFTAADIF